MLKRRRPFRFGGLIFGPLAVFLLLALLPPLLLRSGPVAAIAVDKPLKDAKQEARAREIHKQVRCLVCQNQSIEDSNADLARDLRQLVREQVAAGRTDAEVLDYLVARYGDWVLLEPPVKAGTLVLWAGPPLILVLALIFILSRRRRQKTVADDTALPATAAPLTGAESAQLAAILAKNADQDDET
jgi:cytochrome c-type biogenesis protein CcmH